MALTEFQREVCGMRELAIMDVSVYPKPSCVPRSAALVICLLAAALWATGCVTDFPMVSQEGKIIGGNPKLNDLLHRIRAMRDEHALADAGVVEAAYVASVQPTPQAVSYGGTLPATDKAVIAHYTLVCSIETLDAASIATVTRFLLVRKNGAIRADTYSVLLLWRGNRWDELPMTRLGGMVAAQEKLEATLSPSSRRNAATLPGPTSR